MSKQYNFLDANFFNKDEKSKNVFQKVIEVKDLEKVGSQYKPDGILDPNVSEIEVKDVKKGS